VSALDRFLVVQKFGTRLAASAEIFGVRFGYTPDEEYQRAVDLEHSRAETAEREQQLAAFWSTLLGVPIPGLAAFAIDAVLDLHAPDTEARSWLTCPVCDADELDPGPWPCRTVEAIASAYGIEVPQ
jgi:hypothetical protein